MGDGLGLVVTGRQLYFSVRLSRGARMKELPNPIKAGMSYSNSYFINRARRIYGNESIYDNLREANENIYNVLIRELRGKLLEDMVAAVEDDVKSKRIIFPEDKLFRVQDDSSSILTVITKLGASPASATGLFLIIFMLDYALLANPEIFKDALSPVPIFNGGRRRTRHSQKGGMPLGYFNDSVRDGGPDPTGIGYGAASFSNSGWIRAPIDQSGGRLRSHAPQNFVLRGGGRGSGSRAENYRTLAPKVTFENSYFLNILKSFGKDVSSAKPIYESTIVDYNEAVKAVEADLSSGKLHFGQRGEITVNPGEIRNLAATDDTFKEFVRTGDRRSVISYLIFIVDTALAIAPHIFPPLPAGKIPMSEQRGGGRLHVRSHAPQNEVLRGGRLRSHAPQNFVLRGGFRGGPRNYIRKWGRRTQKGVSNCQPPQNSSQLGGRSSQLGGRLRSHAPQNSVLRGAAHLRSPSRFRYRSTHRGGRLRSHAPQNFVLQGGFSPSIMGSFASNGLRLLPLAGYLGYNQFKNFKSSRKTRRSKRSSN